MKFNTLLVLVTTLCTVSATASSDSIINNNDQSPPQVRRRQAASTMFEKMGLIPSIAKLRLMNAETDLPIAAYDPLATDNTTLIDLSTLPTTQLNVEAVTQGNISWIQWNYNGIIRNEYKAPWALCGNNLTDFFACVGTLLSKRMNATLSATPYYNGGNKTGTTISTKINFYQSTPNNNTNTTTNTTTTPSPLINFTLVNAATDMDIGPLLNGTIVDLSMTPQINIRANPSSSLQQSRIGSVVFNSRLDNLYFNQRIENVAPYAYYGNSDSNYFAWTPDKGGNYTITVTLYSQRNGQGDVLLSDAEVTFLVVLPKTKSPTIAAPTSPAAPTKPGAPVVAPPVVATSSPTSTPIVVRDTLAPELRSFDVLDPIVDASNGNVTAQVQIVVQDDSTGLGRAVVGVSSSFNTYFYADEYIPATPTGNATVTLTFTILFTKYIPEGNYSLFCWLRDDYYNNNNFNPFDLMELNYTSYITVINTDEDVTPPTLLNLVALTPTTVDVSNGQPANVTFKATVQDTKYGIDSTTIFARGAQRNIQGYKSLDPPFVGTYEFIITLTFPAFTPPTNYTLEVGTSDYGFNNDYINTTMLAARGFPSMVQVTNSATDVTPPALLNLTVTPSTLVNASAESGAFVEVNLLALDTESGVLYCDITATYNGNQTITRSTGLLLYPIKGEFPFTGSFSFDSTSWRGNYTLSILLRDVEANEITIGSNELIARGFPGMFTVV